MEPWPVDPDALRESYDAFVARYGGWKAVVEMSAAYKVGAQTVRRRLADAGIRMIQDRSQKPPDAELATMLKTSVAAHGRRAATGKMATEYGVTTVTIRKWLTEAGLYAATPRIPPKPITGPCPCGAVATTRYKGQEPPLCFRCYMRTYAADDSSPFKRLARDYIAAVKSAAACADCGGTFPPCCMHFDHIPERGPKLFNVANCDVSIERLKAEIEKCDIVCANCHAIRTWMTRDKPWMHRSVAVELT